MKTLIIIDMQNYYINDYTKELPNKIFKHVNETKYEKIIFTKFVNHENSNLAKNLNWKKCKSSPETDIVKELNKIANENTIFEKDTYSIFKNEKFINYVKENNITEFIFCGLDTDACILASSYEGFDLGFKIKVINELTLSHSGEKFTNNGLEIINKNLQ